VIAQLIAARRRRLGWSQRYLEDRSGIDQAVISRVENGKQFGVRWARFATLVGVMGGLGDEPHPRHLPGPPWAPTRGRIDLERGGLSAYDEDRLLELEEIRAPGVGRDAKRAERVTAAPTVNHDSGFGDDGDADD
jgi:transcriptional regulator with XRE-family HTH domain